MLLETLEKRSVPTRDLLRYFLLAFHKADGSGGSSSSGSSWHNIPYRPVRRLGSEFLGKRSLRTERSADFDNTGSELFFEPEEKRRMGSEFLGKRAMGSEFLGKRAMGSEFLGKRRMGSEFLGKRIMGSEFLGKRAMGSEFLGKRAMGSEFLGKRGMGSEFLGKRGMGSEFLGKRGMGSEFLGKRGMGSEFLGKRAMGSEFLGKRRMGSEFLGKRRMGSEFLGKRRLSSEFLGKRRMGSEFLGKRSMGSEFLGKRDLENNAYENENTNADILEHIFNQSFNDQENLDPNAAVEEINSAETSDKCKSMSSENQDMNSAIADSKLIDHNVAESGESPYSTECEFMHKRDVTDAGLDATKDSSHRQNNLVRLSGMKPTSSAVHRSKNM
ncbi:hypothetical protein B566_EDAN001722 [Ephemera danica]|nr:hypothetical protein B566_EDAN001722 [Ephemera danica]